VEAARRFVRRLVGQIECAVVHRQRGGGAQIDGGLQRLFRIHVHEVHDRRGRVGADRERCEIERSELLADAAEPVEVARVAGVVEAPRWARDHPTGPQAAIAVRSHVDKLRLAQRPQVLRGGRSCPSTGVSKLTRAELGRGHQFQRHPQRGVGQYAKGGVGSERSSCAAPGHR